jgi:DNA polymerase-3 subunit gamma/tau
VVTAYQSLYRKYRPQSFADLVGQEAALRALQAAIAADRVAHAYLFSGTRGTGKTSTARLLAKAVNCLRRTPGSAEPCNRCESCQQIQNGSALDLIEIDAASNRGIDEIRDLREKASLTPALGRKKVYIIDEAHMLTPEAFNALLKTLEEPPDHVMFVLCTTEANRVPATVLGRCQQFVFRRFSEDQVVDRLAHIAASEGIEAEPEALALIAHVAQGSMRDAIGLMDQLVPLTGAVTASAARDLLGVADPAQIDRLLDQVLAGRAGEGLRTLSDLYEGGGELRQVVRGLMERTRDRLVRAIEEGDTAARDRLSAILDALLRLDGEVRRHAEPRFLVEATLVRIAVEGSPAAASGTSPPGTARPRSEARMEGSGESTPPAGPPPARGDDPGEALEGWRRILDSLHPKTRAYFREARAELDGRRLILSFPYSFHHRRAVEHQAAVEARVRSWLGEGSGLELRLLESTPTSRPAVRPRAPEESPVIKAAERKLEGKVIRVRPLKET